MNGKKQRPTWREMNADTSEAAEALLFDYYRHAPIHEKWERMEQLNLMVRQVALAGLRRRHPTATDAQLQRLLADLLLGPDLAARAYGPAEYTNDE